MGLLKGDKSIERPIEKPMGMMMPPVAGLTISDGFRFGIGFGLALTIALPVILFVLGLLLWILIMAFGGLAGELL
jgi:hypothetical protein